MMIVTKFPTFLLRSSHSGRKFIEGQGASCQLRWLAGPEHGRTNQSPAGCAILSVGSTGGIGQ